jgi:hypothetical protein
MFIAFVVNFICDRSETNGSHASNTHTISAQPPKKPIPVSTKKKIHERE